MVEGTPVGTHILKMIGYIESLERLGFLIGVELAIDVILQSLLDSFSQFVLNFKKNEINKTFLQLLNMLQTVESIMKKIGPKPILIVRKDKGKGKAKAKVKPNKGKVALKPKAGIAKEEKCFHCGKTGH
ncbi:uncharacterized protein [Gossypium hirsutum]|uniref:Uncharacterized protein n=1 Tax=Gossypium hirsutum TaxID=3635 RepID=A0A1U8JR09_GOSHI|nr:uncharacterized protein LOC107907974 [Gossypium hirsutum]